MGAEGKWRFAMVCSSNMNRSMEAHSLLGRAGLQVESYGTGGHVKLPGPSLHEPNVYDFGTPYGAIYDDLRRKDPELCVAPPRRRLPSPLVPFQRLSLVVVDLAAGRFCFSFLFGLGKVGGFKHFGWATRSSVGSDGWQRSKSCAVFVLFRCVLFSTHLRKIQLN
jgi:hypothetical protein